MLELAALELAILELATPAAGNMLSNFQVNIEVHYPLPNRTSHLDGMKTPEQLKRRS